MSERLFRVTYTGDDVHAIPRVGVFQNGTTTVVTEEVAEIVKAHAKFTIVPLDGGAAPKGAPAPAAEKPAEKKPEKVEAKKEEKAEAKKEEKDKDDKAESDEKKGEPAAG